MVSIRRWLMWRHPEWWALMLSAAAWLVIVTEAAVYARPTSAHHAVAMLDENGLINSARDWLLMVVAMMVPLSIASIRVTAERSLWRRRHKAIAAWLAGYVLVCTLLGIGVVLLASTPWINASPSRTVIALAFVAAALWQVSPARARALSACHRIVPLAPDGWRANVDCARYGWMTGVSCSLTCGLLMFACWLLGHELAGVGAMAFATAIGLAERYLARPRQIWLAAPIASIALFIASTAW